MSDTPAEQMTPAPMPPLGEMPDWRKRELEAVKSAEWVAHLQEQADRTLEHAVVDADHTCHWFASADEAGAFAACAIGSVTWIKPGSIAVEGPPEEIGTGLYRMADGEIVGNDPEPQQF